MRDTALSTHDENGTVTIVLNRISNDSEGSSDSVGLELEAAPLNEDDPDPPKRCFEFFRRFSYKRLWGDSRG